MLSKHDLKIIQELLLLQEYNAAEDELFELELTPNNGKLITEIEKWDGTNIKEYEFIDVVDTTYAYPTYKIAAYYADKIEELIQEQEVEK